MANPKRYSEKIIRKEDRSGAMIPEGSYNMQDDFDLIQPLFEPHFQSLFAGGAKEIYAKFEISHPQDQSEIQADEFASNVVKGNTSGSQSVLENNATDINTKGEGSGLNTTPEFDSQLQGTKGQGSKLDTDTKSELESHTGTDLSGVNVHSNQHADQLSTSINAKAFTHGQDIYFKSGNYNTSSTEGKSLLAHEVAHTVQQGNSVQRKIQREPWQTPVEYIQTWQQFLDLNISELWKKVSMQVDWYNSPAFNPTNDPDGKKKETIEKTLEFLQNYNYTSSLHRISIRELIADVNGKKVTETGPDETFQNDPQPTFDALTNASTIDFFYIPNDLAKAKDAPSKFALLKKSLKPNVFKLLDQTGLDALNSLADAQDLIDYVNTPEAPVFENDADIPAFGKVNNATGKKVIDYQRALKGRIRNVHRFYAEALDQLIINYKTTGIQEDKRDRLIVVLYATHDHSGPLVYDPNIRDLVLTHNDPLETDGSKRVMVLIVEGKEQISDYDGTFKELAKTYGRWGRIDQFMIHAHGSDTGLGVGTNTATKYPDGEIEAPGQLSFENNATATQTLFKEVLKAMETKNVPESELAWKSRIVFAACLTNSNDIPANEGAKGKDPQKAIRRWLRQNENLVSRISRMTKKGKNKQNIESVIGSNAVTTASVGVMNDQNQIGLFGNKFYPALAGSKLEYIEFGREVESVFTALLSEWSAIDLENYKDTPLFQAVSRRSVTLSDIDMLGNAYIRNAFSVLVNPPENFKSYDLIEQLRKFVDKVRGGFEAARVSGILTADQFDQFMEAYRTTTLWSEKGYAGARTYLTAQVRNKPALRIPDLIALLALPDNNLPDTIGLSGSGLDTDYLQQVDVYKPGVVLNDITSRGQVVLAIAGLRSGTKVIADASKAFLLPLIETDDLKPDLIAMINDGNVRNFIREKFGLTAMESVKPLNQSEMANLPFQSDSNAVGGMNKLRVTANFSTVYGKNTPVYSTADEALDPIGTIAEKAPVHTSAEYNDWYVIQWPGYGTAFVKQSQVTATL